MPSSAGRLSALTSVCALLSWPGVRPCLRTFTLAIDAAWIPPPIPRAGRCLSFTVTMVGSPQTSPCRLGSRGEQQSRGRKGDLLQSPGVETVGALALPLGRAQTPLFGLRLGLTSSQGRRGEAADGFPSGSFSLCTAQKWSLFPDAGACCSLDIAGPGERPFQRIGAFRSRGEESPPTPPARAGARPQDSATVQRSRPPGGRTQSRHCPEELRPCSHGSPSSLTEPGALAAPSPGPPLGGPASTPGRCHNTGAFPSPSDQLPQSSPLRCSPWGEKFLVLNFSKPRADP